VNFRTAPTIAWRGQLARLRAEVQGHRPEHGERHGRLRCVCGATFTFSIQSNGLSRGQCAAACGARWCN
jgi:hypothetical protein